MNKFFKRLLFRFNTNNDDQKKFKKELKKIIEGEGFINVSGRDIDSFIKRLDDKGLFKKKVTLAHVSSLHKFNSYVDLMLARLKMTGEKIYFIYKIDNDINKDCSYVQFNISF